MSPSWQFTSSWSGPTSLPNYPFGVPDPAWGSWALIPQTNSPKLLTSPVKDCLKIGLSPPAPTAFADQAPVEPWTRLYLWLFRLAGLIYQVSVGTQEPPGRSNMGPEARLSLELQCPEIAAPHLPGNSLREARGPTRAGLGPGTVSHLFNCPHTCLLTSPSG